MSCVPRRSQTTWRTCLRDWNVRPRILDVKIHVNRLSLTTRKRTGGIREPVLRIINAQTAGLFGAPWEHVFAESDVSSVVADGRKKSGRPKAPCEQRDLNVGAGRRRNAYIPD
ncbi:hypothetical protein [Paraburkholderia sp. HP33-1]|uniref:hypothetical protein n=1 Tax=Paraburkholderia sp. HP33-1 TaxID=2883243 RepID=UPI001F24FA4F|nr:hypothetical protein [Paraburkholderia sp. HP33-1]